MNELPTFIDHDEPDPPLPIIPNRGTIERRDPELWRKMGEWTREAEMEQITANPAAKGP